MTPSFIWSSSSNTYPSHLIVCKGLDTHYAFHIACLTSTRTRPTVINIMKEERPFIMPWAPGSITPTLTIFSVINYNATNPVVIIGKRAAIPWILYFLNVENYADNVSYFYVVRYICNLQYFVLVRPCNFRMLLDYFEQQILLTVIWSPVKYWLHRFFLVVVVTGTWSLRFLT